MKRDPPAKKQEDEDENGGTELLRVLEMKKSDVVVAVAVAVFILEVSVFGKVLWNSYSKWF